MRPMPPDHDAEAPLDAATLALLHDTLPPENPDLKGVARVKQRVLRRIATDNTGRHLTVQAAGGAWQAFGAGLQLKVLHETGGVMSYLLRMAAGSQLPAHRHPVDEECIVLEGEVCIGTLRLGAGGFHLGRQDVLHDALRSETGALIYLRGAVPEAALAI